MSHYSTGKALPTLEIAARIADVLEVPLDWLCGTKMEKPTENLYTCGYVVRKMLDIEKGLTVNNSGCIYTKTDKYGTQVTRLETSNEKIIEFFHKNDKFSEMAKENSEAKEMYDAWLIGALAKLDNEMMICKQVPYVAEEDLPF